MCSNLPNAGHRYPNAYNFFRRKRFSVLYRADASGIPVATVAINGGANAAILAAKILATSDEALLQKLKDYKEELKDQVVAKDAKLQEVGYKNYK